MTSPNTLSAQPTCGEAAAVSFKKICKLHLSRPSTPKPILPRTSPQRLAAADDQKTILYLAYGSNLSAETFKGTRGIQPLSAINVHVPSLSLVFDLAGIPYIEPCFANSRYRTAERSNSSEDYHKDRWQKGLIGVVYEVTPEDYRTIIATEGGGASYLDVVVPCYALPDGCEVVNPSPMGSGFKAHTLHQPADDDSGHRLRIHRPDPSYAQPSARYLKLITNGAEEHALPDEYISYLYNIRAYSITSFRQRVGQGIIVGFFMPVALVLILLGKLVSDKEGKSPDWFANIMGSFFRVIWGVYDAVLRKAFGDGERTMGGDEEKACGWRRCEKSVRLEGEERSLR